MGWISVRGILLVLCTCMLVVIICCVWPGYRVFGLVCEFRLMCWNVLLPLWFDFVLINNTGSPFHCCCCYFHFADLSASDMFSHYFLSSLVSCTISLRWALSPRSHLSYPNSQCSYFNLKEREKGETTKTWMTEDLSPTRGKKLISCWQLLTGYIRIRAKIGFVLLGNCSFQLCCL